MKIRHLALAAAMALGLAAGSLGSTGAQAMPLPGPIAPAGAVQSSLDVEQVRLVCRRVWTGHRWTERCVRTAPPRVRRHHHHHSRPHHRPHRHHHHHHRSHRHHR